MLRYGPRVHQQPFFIMASKHHGQTTICLARKALACARRRPLTLPLWAPCLPRASRQEAIQRCLPLPCVALPSRPLYACVRVCVFSFFGRGRWGDGADILNTMSAHMRVQLPQNSITRCRWEVRLIHSANYWLSSRESGLLSQNSYQHHTHTWALLLFEEYFE